MKDAFGNAFSIYLFMFFFIVYVCFIGVALNFAKTYRVKNSVINILEQEQYDGSTNSSALGMISGYLSSVPYKVDSTLISDSCKKMDVDNNSYYVHDGVCIISQGDVINRYYKVVVYFSAEFPFLLGNNSAITIPISGETTVISD